MYSEWITLDYTEVSGFLSRLTKHAKIVPEYYKVTLDKYPKTNMISLEN